ncbi:hypothetical protein BT96DRAFT_566102 [Gymnopus androsaceus JB14]|uniref:Cytochrome P450 n=1 Tax=Gymnopus androsaceus JB14 TaxID=1447944 RepID=A0A6A4HW51_9AGAR|nr:hypothetical protein BT96DRAFT_566102 [Gymnopus androsaceus JB14]
MSYPQEFPQHTSSTMLYMLPIIAAMIIAYAIQQYSVHFMHPSTLLPPGPAGIPIVDNLIDMPKEREWLTYSRCEIVYLKIFGQHMIVLNSVVVVKELLDKRSLKFSDRPCKPSDRMYLLQY